jgi:hypothetical protein
LAESLFGLLDRKTKNDKKQDNRIMKTKEKKKKNIDGCPLLGVEKCTIEVKGIYYFERGP